MCSHANLFEVLWFACITWSQLSSFALPLSYGKLVVELYYNFILNVWHILLVSKISNGKSIRCDDIISADGKSQRSALIEFLWETCVRFFSSLFSLVSWLTNETFSSLDNWAKSFRFSLKLIWFVFVLNRLPPSRAMTPAEQLDIIRSCEVVESMDEGAVSKRDLEVTHVFDWLLSINGWY